MTVLVTGSRGYIGRAVACSLIHGDYDVIGVDNCSREAWTRNTGGSLKAPQTIKGLHEIFADFSHKDKVKEILAIHKPDCIIHLASQPSMPYSDLNGERALFTQINNTAMCINLLWAIKELDLKTRLIITTTTGIPGQNYKVIPEKSVINGAGSWYHVSRGFDSANCNLASRQWGLEVVELRTSIVFGIKTNLMRELNYETRFDTDMYFGTALNRFVQQALNHEPITIYGKGEQMKPFISLQDCVDSLINCLGYPFKEKHTILNQVAYHLSIKDLAHIIADKTGCTLSHIDNPRKENETFKMKFDNKEFLKVLGRRPGDIDTEIEKLISDLLPKGKAIVHNFSYTI